MGMEAKDTAAGQFGRTILDDAGHRIAVFDGCRKLALLEWAAHSLPFALRHFPAKDQRLGAPADGAGAGADQQLACPRRAQPLGSDLAAAWCRDPKRARLNHLRNNPKSCGV